MKQATGTFTVRTLHGVITVSKGDLLEDDAAAVKAAPHLFTSARKKRSKTTADTGEEN